MTSPDTLAQTIDEVMQCAWPSEYLRGRDALDSLLALLAERERELQEEVMERGQFARAYDDARAERDAAVREAATLREALEWYATEMKDATTGTVGGRTDWGMRARAALAAAAPAETAR